MMVERSAATISCLEDALAEGETVSTVARRYTKAVIEELVHIAMTAQSDNARVLACKEVLDRGWGRPGLTEVEAPAEKPQQMFEASQSKEHGKPVKLADFRALLNGDGRYCGNP
jgi:hypothetical protein